MTLAIGDGANDVSMIQATDVGVGISARKAFRLSIPQIFQLPRYAFPHFR